ncbi:hypothetical protein H6F89_01480 [Cyanobacteria bacterium FACHB-63]|nr:hypothetical protein [Cyanobacteria bacterium FACHB-63]
MKATPYQLLAATLLIGSSRSGINPPNAGDTSSVDFILTNVGNDLTQFFIPGTATLSNTTDFELNGSLQIGNTITPVNVPAGSGTTGNGGTGENLLGALTEQGSIPPNGTVTVRVPIRARGTAPAGATTIVSLGNTTPANTQNADRTDNVNNTLDVYTVDSPDNTPNKTPGVLTIGSSPQETPLVEPFQALQPQQGEPTAAPPTAEIFKSMSILTPPLHLKDLGSLFSVVKSSSSSGVKHETKFCLDRTRNCDRCRNVSDRRNIRCGEIVRSWVSDCSKLKPTES